MERINILTLVLSIAVLGAGCTATQEVAVVSEDVVAASAPTIDSAFTGTWLLDASRSTVVDPWRNLSLAIKVSGNDLTLMRRWRGSREGGTFTDSSRIDVGGSESATQFGQWPDNRHLGAYIAGDGTKKIRGWAEDDGRTLVTTATVRVSIQQGERDVRIYSEYRLSPDGNRVDLIELRNTRPTPVHYTFRREEQAQ